mmetsp:Transcript_14643/g.21464  ORF Transcript_14643/g.21464 Transcript_14643/m.21464 type:complete len:128 (-) Transcript_14643:2444-2827(-)
MLDKVGRLVAGKNAHELYERKDAIEQKYGKWYEEERNNPWSTEFDMEGYRELTQQFVRDFTGNGYGGFAVSWNNVSVLHPKGCSSRDLYSTITAFLSFFVLNRSCPLMCLTPRHQDMTLSARDFKSL